ncbi:serine/threonine-protein kinase [Mycolicibacterium parafortuitum]|uniref:non-specific serine/threonine protein kinase n=1 Tax=Mycolicibacterium parafortuitum TaxID=39692 RepID=A0A375YBZ8_MYCPF|nr:serine/threonine-protein kinase [Mycolicibacterium parafortuitum]ORB32020.1 serine/threonine protein kinase [Mycolicibacterium parafortuitum]SRX78621.1 serine/threonine protein kinase [Rhodococcus jostii RHA1] [Mycolicibacterium parafortuitum]
MTAEVLAGRYELRGLLGRGGMAEVRDAWDTRLHRNVAVKLLYPAQSGDAAARARFEDEARSAARLSHPNIVAIHDFGEHEDAPFIVMERLPGRTLADLIEQGPLPAARVRRMLDEVLAALAVAHAAGVLHRDIKPANILLTAMGDSVKVADFGIAKSGGSAHTATGTIVGTMCYLSPQRVTGAPASVSDDLYAVGVMGYEALLGRRAFPQDNPAALARAILDVPPPPLRMLGTDADPALSTVIDRAMSRDPRLRFGSAAQMRAALAGDPAALGADPVTVLTGPPQRPSTRVMAQPLPPSARYPTAPPTAPPTRARKYLLAVAAVLAFAVAALALALEPFSSPAPLETVSTSTSVPPRTTTAPPPTPLSTAPAPVVPAVEPPAPREGPKKGPPDKKGGPGNNGRGNGNGKPN